MEGHLCIMAAKKEELEQKKRLAYTLFVENGFEQKVIAGITGISERSIGIWKKEGNWEDDRQDAQMGFEQSKKRIRQQLQVLLDLIRDRKPPENVPTASEADTINKLSSSVQKLQTELSFAHKAETGKLFVSYIQRVHGQERAVEIVELWHEFLMATA